MHFRDALGTHNATDLAGSLDDAKPSHFLDGIVADASVALFHITKLDGVSATQTFTGGNWIGGSASGDMIPQVARLIKLQTGFRGRSRRGRVFLPFVAESAQNGGNMIGDSAGPLVTTAWNTWRGDLIADGFNLVVASYKLEDAEDVTVCTAETPTATQRRRQSRNR